MRFSYHLNCASSRLTHLCFADDLLIFIDGSLESVQAVLQVLREFEARSGLAVSVHKTSFFASGLSSAETDAIQVSTGMPLGSLPVCYLGVPLCTKKLTLLNCEGLLQQIKSKFSSWSSKALSFAGRNIEAHHTARVSWSEVTKPKREGGLAGSVWVAWFKEEVLNGDLSNLWITTPNRRASNGLSCRFWTDNWSHFGNMREFLQLGPASMGIATSATLASLFTNNSWRLPPTRSERQVQLHAHLTTIVLNNDDDFYEWGMYVSWFRFIWIKGGIPRHSFLAWLFVLNRCPTRDRIIDWGLRTSPLCLLCNSAPESRDHLYFDCPFTWSIWSSLAPRSGLNPARSWSSVLAQLGSLRPQTPRGRLTLLCWQACLYWIWTERNARLHRNIFRSVEGISRLIDRQIKDRLLSFRSSNPAASSTMMQQWLS
ncbi:uncharacterized protein LOC108838571 [Raphanus sativus]|uniref:Uncharacterized protein LOC108838571 n=1 Tax=Raphanus sativus TaxID=3726 RepID=A0A9W3BV71_RAPSA|nr:uncharacterized protein LOC108838571 [Raphanus sativus]